MQILTIDDGTALCKSLRIYLKRERHNVFSAYSGSEGLDIIRKEPLDLVFLDLQLPDINGLEVLRQLQATTAGPLIVIIVGTQDTKPIIEAIRLGAFDYIRKPLDLDAVLLTLEKAEQRPSRASQVSVATVIPSPDEAVEILGASPEFVQILKQIGLLSQNRVSILLEGESGTGNELAARVLHKAGNGGKPFVTVNCSAIVPKLLESELFGHLKDPFTGAVELKIGKLELAGEGTIFFDEISDMSMDLQAKFLHVLQERQFERVGGTTDTALKARVRAATKREIRTLVAEQKFREDLYYRLALLSITVPPLRSRHPSCLHSQQDD